MSKKAVFLAVFLLLAGCIRIASNPPDESPNALPTTAATAVLPPPTLILPTPTSLPATATLPPTATPAPTATAVTVAVPARQRPHYTLNIALDTTTYSAEVTQSVILTNNSSEVWQEIVFNISQAYWPGIFNLNSVELENSSGGLLATTHYLDNTMLHIPLSPELPPGETITVHFAFDLTLPRLDPIGWGPAGNAGWEPGLIQMGDFYPALVPYQEGSGWQTWQYVPVGDPVISGVADYEVTLIAPADYMIAAAGAAGADSDGYHFHLENARAFAFLASQNYVRYDDVVNGIPISVYATREFQTMGLVVLQTAVNALTLFTEQYGPYPYSELIIAENGFLTSNEYSGFISLGGYLFDTHDGGYDSLLVALTAHEIGHQWWYGGVGNDQVNEPWLDESLAMYSELIYYERYHPDLTSWWWQARVDRWNPLGYANATIYDYPDSATFVHNMYGQATYFIWDLRQTMGEAAFIAFLQDYFQANNSQLASTEGFFSLAQSHTDADLSGLRTQYFND